MGGGGLVYAPEILEETEPDRIVILSDSYEEIYQQIMGISLFWNLRLYMKNNLQHYTTFGFIWFPWTIRQNYVSTRLNRAVVRGYR